MWYVFLLGVSAVCPGVHAESELVCVTGGNGFIAGHVCKRLREEGYRVRATVRSKSLEKTGFLEEMGVEIVDGADILVAGSFNAAMIGCDYVHHCAFPFTFDYAVGASALESTLNVLRAAKAAGTVKRIVFLSSAAAITWADPASHPGGESHIWTEDDWQEGNTLQKGSHGYAKRHAEEIAWEFAAASHFDMAAINPGFVLGPVLSSSVASQSIKFFKSLLDGSRKKAEYAGVGVADVRDVAEAHVRAMTVGLTNETGVLNKLGQARFLLSSKRSYSVLEVAQWIKRAGFGGQFSIPTEGEGPRMPKLTFSNERVQSVLGVQPRDILDTITDTVVSLKKHRIVVPKRRNEL